MYIYYTMKAVCDWLFVLVLFMKNTLEKLKKSLQQSLIFQKSFSKPFLKRNSWEFK